MTILIRTDYDVIFRAIAVFFEGRGYPIQKINKHTIPHPFSCLILDNPLPAELKTYAQDPVIVLSEEGQKLSTSCIALEKPLKLEDLFQQCIKLIKNNDQQGFEIGPYIIFPKTRLAVHRQTGIQYPLTEKESAILSILYNAKEMLPRETILENVWGYQSDVDTHTLETHIYKLRKKLFPQNPEEFLITYPRGYGLKI